jgi:hypothetical protein
MDIPEVCLQAHGARSAESCCSVTRVPSRCGQHDTANAPPEARERGREGECAVHEWKGGGGGNSVRTRDGGFCRNP